MTRRYGHRPAHYDVWPVIADAFLTILAVVVVMASGREPIDYEIERLKTEILHKSNGEFAGLIAGVEIRTKWVRLVFTEESLSFPKCQWSLPIEKQQQLHSLFRWLGERRALLRQIRIEGHADRKWSGSGCSEVGPFQDNLQLSQNRARAVYNVLLGLSPEDRSGLHGLLSEGYTLQAPPGIQYLRDFAKLGCLEVAGYGDRHPRDKSDPDSPRNRRVEIVLEFREPGHRTGREVGSMTTCEVSQ